MQLVQDWKYKAGLHDAARKTNKKVEVMHMCVCTEKKLQESRLTTSVADSCHESICSQERGGGLHDAGSSVLGEQLSTCSSVSSAGQCVSTVADLNSPVCVQVRTLGYSSRPALIIIQARRPLHNSTRLYSRMPLSNEPFDSRCTMDWAASCLMPG